MSDGKFECMYGCGDSFDTHTERLEHSLRRHTDVNADKYPNMIGAGDGLKF